METKHKGDIAEQSVALKALKLGFEVLKPLGDRLPYDLVFDINGKLIKIQVKSAWFDKNKKNFVVDSRRTKTNRQKMIRQRYSKDDFDYAIIFIDELDVFYVFPVSDFISYRSEIHLVEDNKRQRKPKSATFREAWNLILSRAS